MKVFDIETVNLCRDIYSVVAKDMATAERLFLKKYPTEKIKRIVLHSEYVIVEEV